MAFNRWTTPEGNSLAWRLFKRHHTHFNRMFWSDQAARKRVHVFTRGKKKNDPTSSVFPLLNAPAAINFPLEKWSEHYGEFECWYRMAGVAALTGYLETYISQIVYAALESCPALVVGGNREIEGVSLLKKQKLGDYEYLVTPIVKGSWGARCAAYEGLFGGCGFKAHIATLDAMRAVRNDVSHSFGRPILSMRMADSYLVSRLTKISDTRLKTFLACVEAVANNVEKDIGPRFVGCYELLRIYHYWDRRGKFSGISKKDVAHAFSKHVYSLSSNSLHKSYGCDLMKYYDNA